MHCIVLTERAAVSGDSSPPPFWGIYKVHLSGHISVVSVNLPTTNDVSRQIASPPPPTPQKNPSLRPWLYLPFKVSYLENMKCYCIAHYKYRTGIAARIGCFISKDNLFYFMRPVLFKAFQFWEVINVVLQERPVPWEKQNDPDEEWEQKNHK